MALPFFFLSYASRIIPIIATVGTALFRFISKNPKIIGSTVSVQAISSAIQSHEATQKEKIDIVNDIGEENPNSDMTFTEIYFILTQILYQIFFLIYLYS